MSRKLTFLAAILIVAFSMYADAYALELEISGNGNSSNSEIQVQVEQETTIEQSNEADVSNEVETEANTGDNEANGNSGETQIQTGDINAQTEITNELNTSVIDTGCCQEEETTITIEGNGADSQNTVELSVSKQTNVTVHQEANINNHINGTANTGRNQANGNNGNVTIDTGDISAEVYVTNQVNHARIEVTDPFLISVSISDNGANSNNSVRLKIDNSTSIEKLKRKPPFVAINKC